MALPILLAEYGNNLIVAGVTYGFRVGPAPLGDLVGTLGGTVGPGNDVNPATTEWYPRYPDRHKYRRTPFFLYSTPHSPFPIIVSFLDIRWAPTYPDFAQPTESLTTGSQLPRSSTVSPIINPPAPAQSWQQPFATPGPRPTLHPSTFSGQVGPLPALTLISPLLWQSHYPDSAPGLRYSLAAKPTAPPFQIGEILDVPKQGGWRPRFPDLLPRKKRLLTSGQQTGVFPGLVITTGICVEWAEGSVTASSLASEVWGSATLAEDSITSSTLVGESLC